jgi:hypothetical protein
MLIVRRIVGHSMSPVLKHGQLVIGLRWLPPRLGAVVILRHEGKEKIKKISEVSGKNIYVVGSNPAASTDSRQFGWLPKRSIVGVVIWPRAR